jgi:hypothetical protein
MLKIENFRNPWFWLGEAAWFVLVLLGKIILGNLFYAWLLNKLAPYGVQESTMLNGLINLGLPLVILVGGFYGIYFCIKKGRQFEEKSKEKENQSPKIETLLPKVIVTPVYGSFRDSERALEMYVQIENKEDYRIEFEELGFETEKGEKININNIRATEGLLKNINSRTFGVDPHRTRKIVIPHPGNTYSKTDKIKKIYIKAENGDYFYGVGESFNNRFENIKAKPFDNPY